MPALGVAQPVAEAMLALKPTRETGAMDRPTDWPEIIAFAQATGRVRETWELEALADMCRAYHRELMGGADPFRIAPIDRRP